VKGTINVLRSCAKVPSVKRVIVTSSLAAVMGNGKPLTSDVVVDETWFSDAVFGEKLKVCAYVKFLLLIISLQVILLTLSL
jgi:nucleoside-diphosphate-sugar epimerase